MSRDTVRVRLEPESLTIVVAKGSPLLSGMHRVYFVNVLGFEPSTEPVGYFRSSAASPALLLDIVDYLQQQDVHAELNASAEAAINRFEAAAEDFGTAKSAGAVIKSSPPRRIEVPQLKRDLKPYQIPAIAHAIAVGNAANFSVPGSGKTAVALSVFSILRSNNEVRKIIVVGPRSSFVPWEEEFQATLRRKPRTVRISGTRAQRMKLYRQAEKAELILMTYQMATKDQNRLETFLQANKSFLVLDESHNIKRLEGGIWAPALIEIGTFATKRMILTGTPAPNSAADLWSQMTFLWPNPPILGTREDFKSQVTKEESGSLDQLREQLFPFYWRTRKRDLRLPNPRFRRIPLTLRPYQQAIYRALAAKVLSDVVKAPTERVRLRLWRTARMVRLLQAASNPALLTQHSTEFQVPPLSAAGLPVDELIRDYHKYEIPVKVEFAIELAKELIGKKQKVLIWTAFIHNIRTLEQSLREFHPRIVYGDVPKDENEDVEFNREQMIQDFRSSADYPVLIANPSACAESVSLHKVCNHAIYLDRTFNAAHYMQSLDRIHRVGMNPNTKVQYYLLQAEDTIDEVIDERLIDKEARMKALLDDDIAVMSLEYGAAEFSEETEEDRDFAALVEQLRQSQVSQSA
ncbi:MAG: DEAD/DEAH box helicase [Acidobacteriia bacterium]|nr:DEAD/DEAH box helicase [Terriglobia bacterium]